MTTFIEQAIVSAGAHLGEVIRMLYDGVAFREGGSVWNVYSHEGDDLGQVSTADVSFAIHFMKQRGRMVGKLKDHPYDPVTKQWLSTYEPAFTFAWEGWFDDTNPRHLESTVMIHLTHK